MYLIGLTGGIASGKSSVARRLTEHGAIHIDADELARRVVEPGQPALRAIADAFGPSVIQADGSLDRDALAGLIFVDPEQRAILNGITHPAIKELVSVLMSEASERNPNAVVVYDVPLLVEARVNDVYDFDLIVVVNANAETRLRRMVELRGLTREEALHRMNSQVGDAERLAIADVVIDANGTLEETLQQADALWESVAAAAGLPA